MIFVTVGTQLPFDRLIRAVDAWAAGAGRREVFAQIGPSPYRPLHVDYAQFVAPDECRRRMEEADVIVAHAGMGTIISALQLGKPVLVMPRLAALGEHRNDHQVATAERFALLGRVTPANNAAQLAVRLDELDGLAATDRIGPYASPRLIGALRTFIDA